MTNDTGYTTAFGEEYINIEDGHSKYWRVVVAGNMVTTQYGAIGSVGSVTVHHLYSSGAAIDKYYNLSRSKDRKGYVRVAPEARFTIPKAVADAAASTNNTGSGGKNPVLGYAIVANLIEAMKRPSRAGDPLSQAIHNGQIDAYRVGLLSLLGARYDSEDYAGVTNEQLEVMAAVLSTSDLTPAHL